MRRFIALAIAVLCAAPALAQHRVDLILDAEGVRRTGKTTFEPNTVRYEPKFDDGGGFGIGLNFFFGDRVSLETKAAALESSLHVRASGSDFVSVADLGRAQIYPITAVLQWHMLEHGSFRPYIGAGAGYVILRDIEKPVFAAKGVAFDNPTGLVVDGGLELMLSRRLSLVADARYTPIATRSRARFTGTSSSAEIDVKPLVVSFGAAVHF